MNFCEKIDFLLEQKGISRRAMLLDLNLNPNSFVNWQKRGTLPTAKTLAEISKYFAVPITYFTVESENSSPNILFAILSSQERNTSLLNGNELPSDEDLSDIAKYLGCRAPYLTNMDLPRDNSVVSGQTTDETMIIIKILNILDKIASSEIYRILQIQISRIIINNLALHTPAITSEIMIKDLKFTVKKVEFLYSHKKTNMFATSNVGLNPSDLAKIYEKCEVSYRFMFTGKPEGRTI